MAGYFRFLTELERHVGEIREPTKTILKRMHEIIAIFVRGAFVGVKKGNVEPYFNEIHKKWIDISGYSVFTQDSVAKNHLDTFVRYVDDVLHLFSQGKSVSEIKYDIELRRGGFETLPFEAPEEVRKKTIDEIIYHYAGVLSEMIDEMAIYFYKKGY